MTIWEFIQDRPDIYLVWSLIFKVMRNNEAKEADK